jgi:hypothetical protein
VLQEADAFADVRIDGMIEDHVNEHRAMQSQLESIASGELRAAIQTLRAHLDAEERSLLGARVVREELVSADGTG